MKRSTAVNVLGLTSFGGGFHDSSVVWVRDGRIEFALSEERLSRIKHDYSFPEKALDETIRYSQLKPSEFDAVAIGWMNYNPFSGFVSRNIWDVPATVFRSLRGQPKEMLRYTANNFIKKKLFSRSNILIAKGFAGSQIHGLSHHLAHASSSFRTSGFSEALSVNLDCFGPDNHRHLWSGATYVCRKKQINLLEYIPPYASLGLFYSAVSVCLGFKFGDGEGKTMGLAAYGDWRRNYEKLSIVCPLFQSDRWQGHASWSDFRLIDAPTLLFQSKWGSYIRRLIEESSREDVAAAAQKLLEDRITTYIDYLFAKTGLRNVVLAGGIFLNVTINGKLSERNDVDRVYVHPFASDGGTAAGAALELCERLAPETNVLSMPTAALGSPFTENEILDALKVFGDRVVYTKPIDLPFEVAALIDEGRIVGWFQGRSEWGPRALGRRSVLGDPRVAGTKERLNRLLKNRDWFMPFAPSILEEDAPEFFERSFYTPFMTFAFPVRKEKVMLVPEIVHKDGTARPHMVRKDENPLYHRMISAFKARTGIPIVLNTSFNRHGLPLVHAPSEAIDHLMWGCVDVLAIGCYIVRRSNGVEPVDHLSEAALMDAYSERQAFYQASRSGQYS
jgi:carbamoyltransferase